MPFQIRSKPQADDFAQAILDTLREPFIVLDGTLRVRLASRSFYRVFGVSPDETEKYTLFELGNGQWNIPDLRRLLADILTEGSTIESYEVEHTFPTIGDRTFLLNARKVRTDGTNEKSILLAMEDVTERKVVEKELLHLALTDDLTGLANRSRFNSALATAMKMGRRFNYGISLMLLDLDRFKSINDTYGHLCGDAVLQSIAGILSSNLREIDLAARLGGDEFAIILVGVNNKNDVKKLAQKFVSNLNQPLKIAGQKISTGVSIGISYFPEDADNAIDLIRRADVALYKAKADGRHRHCVFSTELEP